MQKFTPEQVDFICEIIGKWYFLCKENFVDYESKTHKLGYAKEVLKRMLCPPEEYTTEYMKDNRESNFDGSFTILFKEDESGGYVCEIKEMPYILSQGENMKEAIDNLTDALKLMIEVYSQEQIDAK